MSYILNASSVPKAILIELWFNFAPYNIKHPKDMI